MKYIYMLQYCQTFEQFCDDLKREIGETLFAICNPSNPHQNFIEITIPDSNHKRITECLNYGSCNVKLTNWTYAGFKKWTDSLQKVKKTVRIYAYQNR